MSDKHIDDLSGTETTGHEWDGIKELNTPLPRWWLWTFYGTIIWAIGYAVAYPALPLISTATTGLLGYSSRAQLDQSVAAAKDAQAVYLDLIAASEVGEIVRNDELARFAMAGGQAAFKVYCSQCHGSGAQGAVGYPNLNDDSWIWGGTVEDIYTTISHGVRSPVDDQTRFNEMPAFGRDQLLEGGQINALADYVLWLAGDGVASEEGAALFADNCAGCHGEKGEGMVELGAPALDDAIWLYASTHDEVVAQISQPRHGMMPAWAGKLGDTTVKQLAVYVHSLGGGQ